MIHKCGLDAESGLHFAAVTRLVEIKKFLFEKPPKARRLRRCNYEQIAWL
jgi:hypothetical protein